MENILVENEKKKEKKKRLSELSFPNKEEFLSIDEITSILKGVELSTENIKEVKSDIYIDKLLELISKTKEKKFKYKDTKKKPRLIQKN